MEFNWLDHIFAILVGVFIPFMSLKSNKIDQELLDTLPPKKHLFYTNGLMLIIGAMIAATLWNIAGRPWHDLGIGPPSMNQWVIILSATLLIFYFADGLFSWLNQQKSAEKLQDLSYIVPLNWQEYRHYIFLAFAAGISEEIVFRGFLISYLSFYFADMNFGNTLSILIPALVFSVSHLYQGWWAVLKIFILAVFFGFIFVLSGSLMLVIIIHVFIDLISGLAGVLMSAHHGSKE